jgi:hypothetical protein
VVEREREREREKEKGGVRRGAIRAAGLGSGLAGFYGYLGRVRI